MDSAKFSAAIKIGKVAFVDRNDLLTCALPVQISGRPEMTAAYVPSTPSGIV